MDDDRILQHEKALDRIEDDLDILKKEVHTLSILSKDRHEYIASMRAAFFSILLVGLLQLSGTVWWAATINEGLKTVSAQAADHENRIRAEEYISHRNILNK